MGVHAGQLALKSDLRLVQEYRRSLLPCLEQARRPTLDHHVYRSSGLGVWVLISENWYEEGIESGLVDGVGLSKASGDGLFEDGEVVVVDRIEALFFDELPKPLDEVEIGGISRQEKKLDAKGEGKIPDQPTFLITALSRMRVMGTVRPKAAIR